MTMPPKVHKPTRRGGRKRSSSPLKDGGGNGHLMEANHPPKPTPPPPLGSSYVRNYTDTSVSSSPSTPYLWERLKQLNGSSSAEAANALRHTSRPAFDDAATSEGFGQMTLPAERAANAVKRMRALTSPLAGPGMEADDDTGNKFSRLELSSPPRNFPVAGIGYSGTRPSTIAAPMPIDYAVDNHHASSRPGERNTADGGLERAAAVQALKGSLASRKREAPVRHQRDARKAAAVSHVKREKPHATAHWITREDVRQVSTPPTNNGFGMVTPQRGAEGGAHNVPDSPLGSVGSASTYDGLNTPLRQKARDVESFLERVARATEDESVRPYRMWQREEATPLHVATPTRQSGIPAPRSVAQRVAVPPAAVPTNVRHRAAALPVSPPSHRLSAVCAMREAVAASTKPVPTTTEVGAASRGTAQRMVVVDTSTLLDSDPGVLNLLKEKWTLCIPFTVIDELDGLQKGKHSADKQRRIGGSRDPEWLRHRARELRNWITAVLGQKDPNLRVQRRSEIHDAYDRMTSCNDDNILGFAVYLKEKGERHVMFVTEDKFLRVKAQTELGEAYRYTDLKRMMGVRG